MSLFNWFKNTPQTPRGRAGGAQDPAALKNGAAQTTLETLAAAEAAERRKDERSRLRELLYNVVRESMVRVGVLSSSFKFKVLATDSKGRKFIVMMDLSRDFGSEISQLAEIEALIRQTAKARYNIVVSSVYWRAEDSAATSKAENTPPYRAQVPATPGETPTTATPAAAATRSASEPVLADEIRALKQALASGAPVASARAGNGNKPGKNNTLLTGYEITEIIESESPDHEIAETEILDDALRLPALSPTQYGDLR
jgi:hypothetical protein